MQIKDRIFILSGASSGLGLATARNLYTHGAYVAMLDIDASSGEEARKDIGAERSRFFETDVSETESISAAISGVAEWARESGKVIGGVISAAGVGNPGKVNLELLFWSVTSITNESRSLIGRMNPCPCPP